MSRSAIILILCLFSVTLCFADETKEIVAPSFSRVTEDAPGELTRLVPDIQGKIEPAEISITNEERLTIENLQLKLQVLQGQLDSLVKQLVAKYKIDAHGWSYDVIGGKFIKSKQSIEK